MLSPLNLRFSGGSSPDLLGRRTRPITLRQFFIAGRTMNLTLRFKDSGRRRISLLVHLSRKRMNDVRNTSSPLSRVPRATLSAYRSKKNGGLPRVDDSLHLALHLYSKMKDN